MNEFAYPAQAGAAERQREMRKAFTIGSPAAPGTGFAYGREDLSDLIVELDYQMPDAKLWAQLFKQTIHQTVYQYDVIDHWGYQLPAARGQGEIARPRPDSAQVRRLAEQVATFGILGQVSDTAKRVNLLVDPVLQEVKTQTMALYRSINSLAYYGNRAIAPLTIDGYKTKIERDSPATNVIDCKGAPLSLDNVDQLLGTIRDAPNYGQTSDVHMNPKALATFNRTYVPQGRFDSTADGTRTFNIEFDRFRSIVGNVKFSDTTFIQPGSTGLVSPLWDPSKKPQTPTVGTPTAAPAGSGQKSRFDGSDAGSYVYFVQAQNGDGASDLVQAGGPVNVAAGDVVSIPITGGQGPKADGFLVLRLPKNAVSGTPFEIGQVANALGQSGQVQVTFSDQNSKRPGTTEAFFFDFRPETMFWASLCALEKQDLAKVQTADEFMLTVQGLACLRAPGRVGMCINVGA